MHKAKEKNILFLHGFASSSLSAKARYLREHFQGISDVQLLIPDFNPSREDFEYLTVTGMINRLRQFMIDRNITNVSVIASSLGSLVALHYAHRFGGINRLLLLAPVLSYSSLPFDEETRAEWELKGTVDIYHYGFNRQIPLRYEFHSDGLHYSERIYPPALLHILHGRNDETVPLKQSRGYASEFPEKVTLTELDSDHSLRDQFDLIGKHASAIV